MVNTGTVAKNIFRVVEHILLGDIHNIVHGYFLLQVIGNVNQILPNPFTVSYVTQLDVGNIIKIQIFHDRMRLDMIAKSIKGSIKNTYISKLRLHHREYEWTYDGGLIRNDGTTMLYLILKIINLATSIVI